MAMLVLSHNSEDINRFWHQVLDHHLCLSRTTGVFNTFPLGNRKMGHGSGHWLVRGFLSRYRKESGATGNKADTYPV